MNTKSYYYETVNEWREQAKALFFIDHLGVSEIAVVVKKSRETVSRFLNECEGYVDEMAFRKKNSADRRREYQRQWDRNNRSGRYSIIDGESLQREHDIAALILSREKYYG